MSATDPAQTRGARRRERTEAAILQAAETIFREQGYRGARIEAIAEAADVAVGSIYGHFGNKDGLYAALAKRSIELFEGYMRSAYDPGLRPLEQLLASGDAYLRFHLEHPGAFRFISLAGVELQLELLDEATRDELAAGLEAVLAEFEAVIAAAVDAGEALPADPHLVATFLWGAWNGVVGLSLRDDRLALADAEVAAVLQLGRRMVIEGLAAPSARAADGTLDPALRIVEATYAG